MNGRCALVTGSTSGIGLAIARALASRGCDVMVSGSRSREEATPAIQDIQGNAKSSVRYVQADLKHPDGPEKLCKEIDRVFPNGVDILVNNAGQQHVCPTEAFPMEKWHSILAVNLTAPFTLIRHVIPKMKEKKWGRIVNISSVMGIFSQAGKAPYSATKSGLNGMTRAVALETAPFGITCNAICPGWVDTPLVQAQFEAYARKNNLTLEEGKKRVTTGSMPTKRVVDPEEIAELVIFLCSPAAASITGSPIPVDGGLSVM